MEYNRYLHLTSELSLLEEMLAEIPAENVIDRIGISSRLEQIKAELKDVTPPPKPYKAKLTFRGKPVLGTYGISAEFGSKVAGAFTEAVAAIAADISEKLSYMGKIADKNKNQLLITGTAIGSFGFEFEVPQPEQMEAFPPIAETAIQKVQELMRISVEGTDDEIGELLEEIHPRAVKKTAELLGLVAQNDALCAVDFGGKIFRYSEEKYLAQSVARLSEENIKEKDIDYTGSFQGYLPGSRTFEFQAHGENKPYKGKVAPDIEDRDAEALNKIYLYKPVTVRLHITQVGQGRPRYVLQSMKNIKSRVSV